MKRPDASDSRTLPTACRVASEPMPRLQTRALGVWVDAGARHEPAELNGVAHLLEHMAFKGTRPRSAPRHRRGDRGRRRLHQRLHPREKTAYYARVLEGRRRRSALDIIADIVLHSLFDAGRAREERGVDPAGDRPGARHARRHHLRLCRRRPTPTSRWARRSSAAEEIVAHAARGSPRLHAPPLRARAAWSWPPPARSTMTGWSTWPSGCSAVCRARPPRRPEPARFSGGERREHARPRAGPPRASAFAGCAYARPRLYAAAGLSTALGGGMSSRLFQELRENRGLCYSIFASAGATTTPG